VVRLPEREPCLRSFMQILGMISTLVTWNLSTHSGAVKTIGRSATSTRACSEVEVDKQGRILLPQQLAKELNLSGAVKILGVKTHLEIWKPGHLGGAPGGKAGKNMPSVAASFVREREMTHIGVLKPELLNLLDVQPNSRVVDCTFGYGTGPGGRHPVGAPRRFSPPLTRIPKPRSTTTSSSRNCAALPGSSGPTSRMDWRN